MHISNLYLFVYVSCAISCVLLVFVLAAISYVFVLGDVICIRSCPTVATETLVTSLLDSEKIYVKYSFNKEWPLQQHAD